VPVATTWYLILTRVEYPTMAFAVVFPFLKMANLPDIFQDAYHNAGSCSAARRVLAYGVMENLFTEFRAFPLANMDVSNFQAYATIAKRHTEVALSQLDIFMPANYENIMALVLGSAQAIEMCKPSLCWIMISCAAGLCQNLGYHRVNTMANDTPEDRNAKIHIFWMIYMFDKTLSLRLGRSSIIQDWDISLPFVSINEPGYDLPEGSAMLSYWIKVARVQGQCYEKLFCPAAFLRSAEERTRTAIELVDAMNQAWYERGDATVAGFAGLGHNFVSHGPTGSGLQHSPNETPLPSQHKRYVHQNKGRGPDASEYIMGTLSIHHIHTIVTTDWSSSRLLRTGSGHLLSLRRGYALFDLCPDPACCEPRQHVLQSGVPRIIAGCARSTYEG
jgi:hypothetical protein